MIVEPFFAGTFYAPGERTFTGDALGSLQEYGKEGHNEANQWRRRAVLTPLEHSRPYFIFCNLQSDQAEESAPVFTLQVGDIAPQIRSRVMTIAISLQRFLCSVAHRIALLLFLSYFTDVPMCLHALFSYLHPKTHHSPSSTELLFRCH